MSDCAVYPTQKRYSYGLCDAPRFLKIASHEVRLLGHFFHCTADHCCGKVIVWFNVNHLGSCRYDLSSFPYCSERTTSQKPACWHSIAIESSNVIVHGALTMQTVLPIVCGFEANSLRGSEKFVVAIVGKSTPHFVKVGYLHYDV